MKKLLLALMFVSSISFADIAATMNNKANGKLVLTSDTCAKYPTMYLAYSSMPNSPTLWGCWYSDKIYVHIRWDDGDYRTYPLEWWTVNMNVITKMKREANGGSI